MSRIDEKPTSQLTPTPEEVRKRMAEKQGIQSAASYSTRALKKQQQTEALKGRGKPLGGAPPLDPKKMAAAMPRPTFGQEEEQPKIEVQEPPKERKGPAGVGSAYEVNQAFARGEVDKPLPLGEANKAAAAKKKSLSPETVEALKMAQIDEGPPAEEEIEEHTITEPENKKRLEDSEKDLVDLPFEFDAIRNARAKSMSDKRRAAIEGRLKPLQIEDMVVNREIMQTIPIVPDKVSVTLRTFNQREHLFCLRYVYRSGSGGSQLYVEELLNTCKMACAIFAINGALLPEHRVKVGERGEEVNEDKFEDKLFHLSSFPVQLLADFSVQLIWFNDRVNQLLSLDNLKNG